MSIKNLSRRVIEHHRVAKGWREFARAVETAPDAASRSELLALASR